MAQQKGILPLQGTIGNITFYKSQDGYLAREKGGLSAERIANDPAFARTRENGAEFGRAGKAGKILRSSLRGLLVNVSDGKMVARLTKEMMRVIKADAVNDRGQRNVIDGEVLLLNGFDFNISSKLGSTLFAPYTVSVNRVSGLLTVNVPSFIPANMVAAPAGATHFKLVSAGAAVDFENNVYDVVQQAGSYTALDGTTTSVLALDHQLPANSTHPLFLVMGVEFYQQVNSVFYSLKNGAFNALTVINVDTP